MRIDLGLVLNLDLGLGFGTYNLDLGLTILCSVFNIQVLAMEAMEASGRICCQNIYMIFKLVVKNKVLLPTIFVELS